MDLLNKLYSRGYISAGVIALFLVYLLKMTWFKWGDLIIDLGREVYVPAKLAEGAVLYRDIFYLYGPFPPYFNALLYKLFGTNILSLVIGGILVTALTACLLYKISRMFLNVFFATFTVLAFLFVLAFGHYNSIGNYNFILPYSYPATHAIVFALGALYFLFRFLDKKERSAVYFSGACIFFSLISKAEIGAMLAFSVLVVLVIMKFSGAKGSFFRSLILFPLFGAFLVYSIFFFIAGPRIIQSNLFDFFKSNIPASPFVALLSGGNELGRNIALMLTSAVSYVFLTGWFILAGYGVGCAGRLKRTILRRVLYIFVAVVAVSGAGIFLKTVYNFELQYRSIPVIFVIVGILSVAAYMRSGKRPGQLKLFVLALFSFLVITRIILYIHAWHYGFYMLVPGLIIYHVFFFCSLPSLMRNRHIIAALYAGFTAVLLLLAIDHVQISKAMYEQRTLRVASQRGDLFVFASPQGEGAKVLIDFLRDKTSKDATVAVFPEGLMINFLAERENPLYYYTFLPQDMVRESVEQAMVDDLALKRPDYVIVLQRSVEEYGSRGFGVDYAQKILGYVQKNYTPLAQYGPLPFSPDNFSAVIFKLKQ